MASLDILYFNPFNFRNKIMKTEHKRYFMAHQKFWKIFHGHQYMPKIFHAPYKNPPVPSPTYLMYGP